MTLAARAFVFFAGLAFLVVGVRLHDAAVGTTRGALALALGTYMFGYALGLITGRER